ncbi:MAG: DUF2807 domain-containing protein [Dehalococcoidales bacterium]|nr:DUF2807 domain-containing protein [Dehalococcoidales bacterium]
MKKMRILAVILSALLLGTFLFSGCGTILVTKSGENYSGEQETRQYDFNEFTGVDISSAVTCEIQQSDTYSISVTAGKEMFDDIKVKKEGKTLVIGVDFPGIGWTPVNFGPYPKAVITMPRLERLDFSGATEGTVTGFSSEEDLYIAVSGASKLDMKEIHAKDVDCHISGSSDVVVDITAEDAYFEITGASELDGDITVDKIGVKVSGSSDADLDGSTGEMSLHSSGASGLEMDGLKAENASIVLSGSSDADIYVTGLLNAELSGASSLEYAGDPELGNIDISTSSDMKRR